MLTTGLNYIEAVTWKKAVIDGSARYWCNSFQFATPVEFTHGTMRDLLHNLATAEQFMYPGDTHQFGFMAWQWSAHERFAAKNAVYIWPEHRFGVRPMPEPAKVIEWPYALLYNKEVLHGHSGRMAFRHTLLESETVPYRGDGRAIAHDVPYGIFHSNLILFYLNNSPIQYANFLRESELSFPMEIKPVERITRGSLTKLQSIEDAQARKTPRARPYEMMWREALPDMFANVQEIYRLCASTPDGMPKADVQTLETMAGMMKAAFERLLSYWTEGIKPMIMDNWRPTSGLDPLSPLVQIIVGECFEAVDEFAPIIEQLFEYPGLFIPLDFVMPFILLYSWYVLQYERCGAMRWTGTPLPPVPQSLLAT